MTENNINKKFIDNLKSTIDVINCKIIPNGVDMNNIFSKLNLKLPCKMFNGKDITKLALDKPNLSIKEFVNETEFKIDEMYIDKFWNNLEDDKPILIDDVILRWLGYKNFNFARKIIKKVMNNNEIEYKIEKYENINFENKRLSDLKQIQFILIMPDQFRDLCMMVNTPKGKEIRKYYIQLEKLFKNYISYQLLCDKIKLQKEKNKNKILKNKVEFIKKHVNKNESVYLSSNDEMIKEGLFKIGTTKNNSNSRVSNLNTGRINDLKVIEEFKTFDGKHLESRIHNILKSCKIKREFYKVSHKILYQFIDIIKNNYHKEIELINNYIDTINNNKTKKINWEIKLEDQVKKDLPIIIYNDYRQITNNNIDNSINLDNNNEEKAKEWLKKNCPNQFKIKDIIMQFKQNNKNVKHTTHYIAKLLKELNFKKKASIKGIAIFGRNHL